jgi:20S proteasome alpha/beta subunit
MQGLGLEIKRLRHNMTLAISITAKDGVALAADTRVTSGDPRGPTTVNDTVKKIFELGDFCGLSIAGDGGLGASVIDAIYYELHKNPGYRQLSVDEMMVTCREKAVRKYNEWFTDVAYEDRPTLHMMISGYRKDISHGGFIDCPEIFTLHSERNFAPHRWTLVGFMAIGITPLATYLLNTLYTKEITLKHALELAVFAILETASQDGKVGKDIQLASFSLDKPFRLYTQEETVEFVTQASRHRMDLRKAFYVD